MANEKMVRLDEALEAVHAALSDLDLVKGPDLSDADVVGEAIKHHGHSLSDMGLDIDDVADEDWVAENIDLDRVMGNHSCGDLTEKLCEYHGTGDVLDEVQSSMGRAEWGEFIVGEAVHTLGYMDQSILLSKLLKQDDGGRTEAALKEHGWVKEEERAATAPWCEDDRDSDKARLAVEAMAGPYLVDALMNRHGAKAVLEMVKAWGVEGGVDSFKPIREEIEVEVKKQMAERIMACLFGGGL